MTAFAPLRCARTPKLSTSLPVAPAPPTAVSHAESVSRSTPANRFQLALQLRHGQTTAVAEKKEGIRFVARPELEVAGDVHHRRPLTELGP